MEAPNAREARLKRGASQRHSPGGLGSWDRLGGLARSPCLSDATRACGSKDEAFWLKEGAQELEMKEQRFKVLLCVCVCVCACVHVCMCACDHV